jgi:hypothetical protein
LTRFSFFFFLFSCLKGNVLPRRRHRFWEKNRAVLLLVAATVVGGKIVGME